MQCKTFKKTKIFFQMKFLARWAIYQKVVAYAMNKLYSNLEHFLITKKTHKNEADRKFKTGEEGRQFLVVKLWILFYGYSSAIETFLKDIFPIQLIEL